MNSSVIAPSDGEDQPEQRAGERERLAPAALLEQLGEHGHERRRQRGVGEQRAHQVRDLERERERRAAPLVPKKLAATISRTRPGDPRQPGGDREDRAC